MKLKLLDNAYFLYYSWSTRNTEYGIFYPQVEKAIIKIGLGGYMYDDHAFWQVLPQKIKLKKL